MILPNPFEISSAMQFWFIVDGEKQGPFEDYELRSMIREGRIEADTKVWFQDAKGWMKASEVRLLKGEFEVEEPEPEKDEEVVPPPPFLMWRRLGARWFDNLVYQTILVTFFRIGGIPIFPDLDQPPSGWTIIALLLPVIIMEAALISSIGLTPGKWLLNLRVTNHKGGLLTTGQAMMRSMRVWVLGMGMREPIILIFGHLFNFWIVKKRGAPLWDLTTGFRVSGKELTPQRVTLFWVMFFLLFVAFSMIVYPEAQQFSEAWQEKHGK